MCMQDRLTPSYNAIAGPTWSRMQYALSIRQMALRHIIFFIYADDANSISYNKSKNQQNKNKLGTKMCKRPCIQDIFARACTWPQSYSHDYCLYTRYPIVARRAWPTFRPSASREQRYLAYKTIVYLYARYLC